MTSAAVQQFLARCVVDPPFLQKAREDLEKAISGLDLTSPERRDFLTLDLDRLSTFVGLITKVQNNGLWQTFPQTRLLVDQYGLDLDLFSSYHAQHQCDRADQTGRTNRAQHFAAFFPSWLASIGASRYPGLLDLFQHERLCFEQRLALQAETPEAAPNSNVALFDQEEGVVDRLIPKVRDLLLIEFFHHDPGEIIHALETDRKALANLREIPRVLAYWGDRQSFRIRIFEVDPELHGLLGRVDGIHSLGHLLPAEEPLRSALRAVVRQMTQVGVLNLREGS
jgi:hypothetical protein